MRTKSYQNNHSYFIKKDIALSSNFSEYFVRNREVFEELPDNPCIIVIDPKDKKWNREKIALGRKASNGKKCYVAQRLGKEWEINPIK